MGKLISFNVIKNPCSFLRIKLNSFVLEIELFVILAKLKQQFFLKLGKSMKLKGKFPSKGRFIFFPYLKNDFLVLALYTQNICFNFDGIYCNFINIFFSDRD